MALYTVSGYYSLSGGEVIKSLTFCAVLYTPK